MNELLAEQSELFRMIARTCENFQKIGEGNYTVARIHSRIEIVKETWIKCIRNHTILCSKISERDKASHPYFQHNQLEVYEAHYHAALGLMQEWLAKLEPIVSHHSTSSGDSLQGSSTAPSALSLRHLPPIKLPLFSGDLSEWESFRDKFTALIITHKELSDFTRMHFLATSLSESAYNVISSYPVTADNFTVAWNALVQRYENKRRLIELHISALYNLPSISRETASELHALRDQAAKSISALKLLGRSEAEVLNDLLVFFVASKLDSTTKRAWKIKCSGDAVPPHYNNLIEFISSRALALEEPSSSTPKVKPM